MNQRNAEQSAPVLTLAVIAALGAASGAAARTVPYQAAQRMQYGEGLGQTELPKGGRFEPRVEAAIQYVSNINLAEDGEDAVGTAGLELSPGFYASYSSGSALAAIDYSLIGRAWEDSDYNDVSHRLSANGEWSAVPDWFSLSGQASYGNSIIDAARGLNYGGMGIFGPGNLSEVASASVSPLLQHRFGDFVASARYQYGRTWYLDEGLGTDSAVGFVSGQDSQDQSAGISVGTADEAGSKLTGAVSYDWQTSEYDNALPYEYERAAVDVGLQVARTLRLLGDYGKESDLDASTTQGGLDSEFWSAGLRWDPSERTSLEGRYGNRFFGKSWSASATHRARLLEFRGSYSEQPTVETRTLSLGRFDPGTLPPGFPVDDFGRFNSAPYVARNASASVTATGLRTTLSLTGFRLERDYLTLQRRDESNIGLGFDVNRELASNLSADFSASYSDYERSSFQGDPAAVGSTINGKDATLVLRLNRKSGEKLTLSGETGYLTRSGTLDYDGWWAALRARWTP